MFRFVLFVYVFVLFVYVWYSVVGGELFFFWGGGVNFLGGGGNSMVSQNLNVSYRVL